MAEQTELFKTVIVTETLVVTNDVSIIFERNFDENIVKVYIGMNNNRSALMTMPKDEIKNFINALIRLFDQFSLDNYEHLLYNLTGSDPKKKKSNKKENNHVETKSKQPSAVN